MLRIRWLALIVAVASFSAGAAVAASKSSETTPVTADFQARIVSEKQRPCDAGHTLFRVTFAGTQTSSDPRLTGNLEARVRSVVNTTNGYGYSTGSVAIRDASTGNPKFHGRAVTVLEPGGGAEGFLVGRTVGPQSTQLLANFSIQQDQTTGAITGELGKDTSGGATKDPAILTNACRGGRFGHAGGKHGQGHGKGARVH
jgi:hypothetical protein